MSRVKSIRVHACSCSPQVLRYSTQLHAQEFHTLIPVDPCNPGSPFCPLAPCVCSECVHECVHECVRGGGGGRGEGGVNICIIYTYGQDHQTCHMIMPLTVDPGWPASPLFPGPPIPPYRYKTEQHI